MILDSSSGLNPRERSISPCFPSKTASLNTRRLPSQSREGSEIDWLFCKGVLRLPNMRGPPANLANPETKIPKNPFEELRPASRAAHNAALSEWASGNIVIIFIRARTPRTLDPELGPARYRLLA